MSSEAPSTGGIRGSLALVLHAHQPFVREAGGAATAAEEHLFEAVTRCYLPVLTALTALADDRVPFRIALSASPTLLDLLSDRLVQQRYLRHLDAKLAAAERACRATGEPRLREGGAEAERERLRSARRAFVETWSCDLVSALRALRHDGVAETLASPATQAYLPLLASDPGAVRAQLRVGLDEHRRHFGEEAAGVWLPISAWAPDLDEILAELGVRYVLLDARGLTRARPRAVMAAWWPIVTPAGIVCFGRDRESWTQVASAGGYPSDADYHDTMQAATGAEPTSPPVDDAPGHEGAVARMRAKVEAHASNFVTSRERQIEALATATPQPPIVVSAYDVELFGLRWHEGPAWLTTTIRKMAYDQRSFALVTPSEHLSRHPLAQECRPAASSEAATGCHASALSGETDWIYLPLHRAGARMHALARGHADATGLRLRAMNQAARELLLAQSGDWALRMAAGLLVNDAVRRTRLHLARFTRLARDLEAGSPDETWLADVEARDNAFPGLDYRVFR